MKRILLVDDDPFFHTTFSSLLKWEDYGFTIACQAENGPRAISLLAENPIDIVFTDMVMPGMSGVELIRYIRRVYPKLVCVALSSFDDFDYVRQSLKEGAIDYLLKHALNLSTLLEMLKALSPEAPLTGEAEQKSAPDHDVFSELLIDLIRDDARPSPVFSELAEEFKQDFPAPPLIVVGARIQNVSALLKRFETQDRFEQFVAMAVNITQSALEHYGTTFTFTDHYDSIYAVVSNDRFSSRLFETQTAHMLGKSLSSILNRYLNIEVCVATDAVCMALNDVLPALRRLESAIAHQSDADYLNEESGLSPMISVPFEVQHQIAESLRHGTFEDVSAAIQGEFEACRNQSCSRQAVAHIALEFLNLLNRICQELSLRFDALFGTDASPYATINRIASFRESVEFVSGAYQALYHLLHDHGDSGNRIVQNAIRTIRNCYAEDISLTSVARDVHCNAAYLSRVFKAETGRGFVQYLTDYRLSQAQKLMDSGKYPIREVAERTGFSNYNYFFRIFKQCVGITPQSYMRKRLDMDIGE